MFKALDPSVMGNIVDKFIKELGERLADRKATLSVTDAARKYLAEKGYDPQFGARPLARVIEGELTRKLTDEILFGALENGGSVEVGFDGKELSFAFTPLAPEEKKPAKAEVSPLN